uniref:Cytidyltransferase-like domain-containing protein n=1 Tax=Ditylenchus dipsaci TaxID=166011 RepID=A0A915DEN5_9BILA
MVIRMKDVGLLVLRGSRQSIEQKLQDGGLLKSAMEKVRKRLYVKLELPSYEHTNQQVQSDMEVLVPMAYLKGSIAMADALAKNKLNGSFVELDMRVLLGRQRQLEVDEIFEEQEDGCVLTTKDTSAPVQLSSCNSWPLKSKKPFNSVVIGGTFDRIHNGHKVLLSAAVLFTNRVLTCGITDTQMIKNKKLKELIAPVEQRCKEVEEFVLDVSDGIEIRAVPISDPFGPSIVDPEMECIVVSPETFKGGQAVNHERQARELSTLTIHTITLVDSEVDNVLNETKLSSSAKRRQALGSLLREPKIYVPGQLIEGAVAYVIGLTGGICSGKSHIASYLLKKYGNDFEVIDCDKLGHQVYAESAELRHQLAQTFGPVVIKDGLIDRKALGAIVFGDKAQLQKLSQMVWPFIAEKAKNIIRSLPNNKVAVLDAAVLLEAGWDSFVHQVWTTFVPREEAVKRVCGRDNLTTQQAESRVDSQLTNEQRIAKSNVVLCSLWDYKETESQVDKAVGILNTKYRPKQ